MPSPACGGTRGPPSRASRQTSWAATTRRLTRMAPAGASAGVGGGPQEEREAMVRAMQRRDLLNANDEWAPDSVGRIKRRTSDDKLSSSVPPAENEDRDALVYVHHVQPQDTLAGL